MKTQDLTQNDIRAIEEIISEFPPYGEHEMFYETDERKLIELGDNAIQYLIDYGYIVIRRDLDNSNISGYYQLTERGRFFKECGTIEELKKVDSHNARNEENEYRRNKNTYYLTFCIAVGTAVSAIFYISELLRIHYGVGLPYHIPFGK